MSQVETLVFCSSEDLPEGTVKSRTMEGLSVAVARQGGRLYAFGGMCPHQHADFADGMLEPGGDITCSWHLWRFSMSTGECSSAEGVSVPVYPVREEEGEILVEADLSRLRP
ncbi:MAG: Rieske (2Fe-2S) protein [Planctomycetota bacterium]|nr:Rieske (2Fe-2S) protein [Planctomycetota bacterium]